MSVSATAVRIRELREEDYESVIASIGNWWGNDRVIRMLPRLFFRHFAATSLAAESGTGGEAGGAPTGFLVGIVSPSVPAEAHVHFVGVAPELRGEGVGRAMYSRFFEIAAEHGCTRVTALTSPANTGSQNFHTRMGFRQIPVPDAGPYALREGLEARQPWETVEVQGLAVWRDWDGPGEDRVRFERVLTESAS